VNFMKYIHLERIGSSEVEGILDGKCHIFPKIDGANASAYLNNGIVCCGSRNHELGEEGLQGFAEYIHGHEGIKDYLTKYPNRRLYGEWLVPHTLRTYHETSWRKFYVFDVWEDGKFLRHEEYFEELYPFKIYAIPHVAILDYPSITELEMCRDANVWLMQEGEIGEGIVIKNYDFMNRYGRITWAKMVIKQPKIEKTPKERNDELEANIVDEHLTDEIVLKVLAKIENQNGGWSTSLMPQLLGIVWYDFVQEEIWDIVKKHKMPTLNFKLLQKCVNTKIKRVLRTMGKL